MLWINFSMQQVLLFPGNSKLADATGVSKKDGLFGKTN